MSELKLKSEYKHSQAECKEVFKSVSDLILQIDRIQDQELRHQICMSAYEMCERLLREPDK